MHPGWSALLALSNDCDLGSGGPEAHRRRRQCCMIEGPIERRGLILQEHTDGGQTNTLSTWIGACRDRRQMTHQRKGRQDATVSSFRGETFGYRIAEGSLLAGSLPSACRS